MAAETVTTQNSPLRETFKNPIEGAVNFIDKRWPDLTPDQLTDIGTAGVIITAALAAAMPKQAHKLVAPYTVFSLFDVIDGALARKRAANHGTETTAQGARHDLLSDRLQEFVTFLGLSSIAKQNNDKAAATIYLLEGMSSPLPSLFRARAESHEVIVPETSLGTRPVRAVFAGAGLAFSRYKSASRLLSSSMLAFNLRTAAQRQRAVRPHSEQQVGTLSDPAKIDLAEKKYADLKYISAATAVAGTIALTGLLRSNGRHSVPGIRDSQVSR